MIMKGFSAKLCSLEISKIRRTRKKTQRAESGTEHGRRIVCSAQVEGKWWLLTLGQRAEGEAERRAGGSGKEELGLGDRVGSWARPGRAVAHAGERGRASASSFSCAPHGQKNKAAA